MTTWTEATTGASTFSDDSLLTDWGYGLTPYGSPTGVTMHGYGDPTALTSYTEPGSTSTVWTEAS